MQVLPHFCEIKCTGGCWFRLSFYSRPQQNNPFKLRLHGSKLCCQRAGKGIWCCELGGESLVMVLCNFRRRGSSSMTNRQVGKEREFCHLDAYWDLWVLRDRQSNPSRDQPGALPLPPARFLLHPRENILTFSTDTKLLYSHSGE